MNCEKLHPFADGEMNPSERTHFLEHLRDCAACQAGLEDLIQLQLLEHESAKAGAQPSAPHAPAPGTPSTPPTPEGASAPGTPSAPPAPIRLRHRWTRVATAAAALAAAVLLALALPSLLKSNATGSEPLAMGPTRSLEARLTHPGADFPRPYQPRAALRSGGGAAHLSLPMQKLAELESRRDYRGIAALYLLYGYPEQAALALEQADAGPDTESDRAAVALAGALADPGEGRWRALEEALVLTERVLEQRPTHPQALFNRAIALRELRLTALAAGAFEQAAGSGRDDWSREARANAEALRAQSDRLAQGWRQSDLAGRALARFEGPLPLEAARANPGLLRLFFYDAVRSATSPEQVRSLQPLAAELDRLSSGPDPVLQRLVRDVARRDFTRRAPLARDYGLLVQNKLPAPLRDELLARTRRGAERDILLGLLVRVPGSALAGELDALADDDELRRDPWLRLVLEQERARQEVAQGQWERAERRLLEAARACGLTGLSFRCARVHKQLVDLYVALHRTNDAHRHAFEGMRLAREAREWTLERELLQELAQLSRFRNGRSLARAYLQETLARAPSDCLQRAYVHEELAAVELLELRRGEARNEMLEAAKAARECGRPLGLSGALVLAELARSGELNDDERLLREALGAVRARRASPGEQALATAIEGRFLLERDPTAGASLLQRAISEAEAAPLGGDVDALKARSIAYTALILQAGKAGAFGQALELLARQLGTDVPPSCALAVVVDDERTLMVARGSGGEVTGHFDPRRTRPLENELSGLVPAPLLQALEGGRCERVEVLAPPPVNGRAGLLPARIAWSYRLNTPRPEPRAQLPERRLVVANVKPPETLRLEPLRTWAGSGESAEALVLLSGAQATPSRVLAEMRSATEIEIHAHGLLDPELSDASLLALSPDDAGRYALTAGEVRQAKLEGTPLVLLAACEAAHTAPQLHQPYSLPAAFLRAGARVVLAATVKIPDDEAPRFFDAVRARIRAGAPPAVAVRDERQAWLSRQAPGTAARGHWVEGVLVFE